MLKREESSSDSFERLSPDEDVSNDVSESAEQNKNDDELTPIPDITIPTEFEKLQSEDPFLAPIKEEQKQFYTNESSNRAINTLIVFSLMMFTVPFFVMATTYYGLFRDFFDLPPDTSMLYAGLCGVLSVFVIIFWFIKIAYDEEKEAERLVIEQKKKG